MFNLPPDKPRASGFNTDSYGFTNQGWSTFDFGQGTASSSGIAPEHNHDGRQSFNDVGGMEWDPTPSDVHPNYHHGHQEHQDHQGDTTMELEGLSSPQNGGGVGRLVAHFENKGFNPFENKTFEQAPPLPPRPINTALNNQGHTHEHHHGHHQTAQSPSISMNSFQASLSFDSLSYCGNGASGGAGASSFNPNRIASPVTSPGETWGSFTSLQRVTSPIATSPPAMSYGSFQDNRVASPGLGSSSGQFGNLDDFMSSNRMQSPMAHSPMHNSHMASSPMMASPMASALSNQNPTPVVGGTPGFEIWRPPGTTTTKMNQSPPNNFSTSTSTTNSFNTSTNTQNHHSHNTTAAAINGNNGNNSSSNNSNTTNSAGFFKPPVPTTPKPNISMGNQFILELNPSAKARGKAPAKPPRPRVPPPVPTPFATEVKQEPATPKPSEVPAAASSPAPLTPSISLSVSEPTIHGGRLSLWECEGVF